MALKLTGILIRSTQLFLDTDIVCSNGNQTSCPAVDVYHGLKLMSSSCAESVQNLSVSA